MLQNIKLFGLSKATTFIILLMLSGFFCGCMLRTSATFQSVPYPVMLNSRANFAGPSTSFRSSVSHSYRTEEGSNKLSVATLRAAQNIENPCVHIKSLTVGSWSNSAVILTVWMEDYINIEAEISPCASQKGADANE